MWPRRDWLNQTPACHLSPGSRAASRVGPLAAILSTTLLRSRRLFAPLLDGLRCVREGVGARSSESSCREDKVCWLLPRAARAGLELLTRR